MKSHQTPFFVTHEDIYQLLKGIEAVRQLSYNKAGLLELKEIVRYVSVAEIPELGLARSGDWNNLTRYLIAGKDTEIQIREVSQRTGHPKFAIDQLENPKTLDLKIGGIYETGSKTIVAGRFSTVSEDPFSLDLYQLFRFEIRKRFDRINEFYVGPSAEERLKQGWRLVTNDKMPKEMDLSF